MKQCNTESKDGFTVIELMITIVATAVFVMAVGAMLVAAWTGWQRNTVSVQMQRDTSLALQVIAREVRRTPLDNITPGSSLTCVNTNGTVSITASGGDLNMQVDANPAFTLVRDHVTAFTSATNATGAVTVQLTLGTGTDSSTSRIVVYSRN